MRFLRSLFLLSIVGLGMAVFPSATLALTIELDTEFSGADAPTGPAPWVVITVEDVNATTVKVTISNSGLTGSEFSESVYLNLNPAIDPTNLTFNQLSGEPATFSTDTDAFKADGDGFFDILVDFPPPPGSQKFEAGETAVFEITHSGGISAADFDYQSASGGGNGTFTAAAHIQGIGPDGNDSGWIGDGNGRVPEPGTLILLGMGLAFSALFGASRRRKLAL
ncbi:MAG: PEP-CTERM sorting domain-containing protein [Planctomycetes bacterium]|nr:PEP-CTERM sorting domain-containing protein [Planctomycetota bacterium]